MTVRERALTYLEALNSRSITLREVAHALQCNECYLSRVLSPLLNRIQSAHSKRKARSKLAESRKQMREKHANLVKVGQKSLKRGAADARCSERTIRRYIANAG
jgi:AraC-like DNA-binding protein